MTIWRWWIVLLVLLTPFAQAATPSTGSGQAPHAFLDRTHVSLGDTVTLNIETDGSIGNPDLAPLQKDFEVLGASRSSSTRIVNGKASSTSQLGIALKPRHAGTLTIPPLSIGGVITKPLTLHVTAAPVGGKGTVGDPVFMTTSVLSSSPYVGEQTVYTVRLYYQPGVDGSLGDPHANGARLVRLDRDHRYTARRNGYAYRVLERSWALIPEHDGAVSVRGPEFQGRNLAPGNLNKLLNDPNSILNNPNALNGPFPGFGVPVMATAPVTHVDARAVPANVAKPWLPARDVQLKLTGLPADGKLDANTPLTVTLSISASGQPADALPEPQLPPITGAHVYPDQTQNSTDNSGEWLEGARTRSFAIVPDRNGTLTIPAITLNWWDVTRGHAEQATLPAHTFTVSGVSANTQAPATPPASVSTNIAAPAAAAAASGNQHATPVSRTNTPWKTVALASIAAWLLAIIAVLGGWGVWRWRRPTVADDVGKNARGTGNSEASVSSGAATQPATPDSATSAVDTRALQRQTMEAARAGDAAVCEHALLAWAHTLCPEISHAGLLRDALADNAQREALDVLQRARWQGEDAVPACAAVAEAFARGFAWRGVDKSVREDPRALPPLYPWS